MVAEFPFFQLETSKLACELWVNAMPVARLGRRELASGSLIPAGPYLVQGTNKMDLVLATGDRPTSARERRGDEVVEGVAAARLIWFPKGALALPENGRTVMDLNSHSSPRDDDGSLRAIPVPWSLSTTTEVRDGRPRWAFEEATPLDPAAVEGLFLVFLRTLESALRSDDVASIFALRNEELAQAYGDPRELIDEHTREAFAEVARDGDILRWDRDAADHRIVGDGRVLDCVAKDWRGSIQYRRTDETWAPLRVLLAWVDGALRVVR